MYFAGEASFHDHTAATPKVMANHKRNLFAQPSEAHACPSSAAATCFGILTFTFFMERGPSIITAKAPIEKSKGKRQKLKGKNRGILLLIFAFCLLPFDFFLSVLAVRLGFQLKRNE